MGNKQSRSLRRGMENTEQARPIPRGSVRRSLRCSLRRPNFRYCVQVRHQPIYRQQLIMECQRGNYDAVRLILNSREDVNMSDCYGETPLTISSARGYLDIVDLLLIHTANVNKPNNNGTPLLIASQHGHFKIVKLLLEHGAKVNMTNSESKSALMLASQNGHENIVEFLIIRRADINMQDKDGTSALMLASVRQHKHIVRMLIERGADIHAQNKEGVTALQIVRRLQNEQNDVQQILSEAQTNYSSAQATITADQIAARLGIDSTLLDQPFSKDLVTPIASHIPNWLEYAHPLRLTEQEINGINTDLQLTYCMKPRELLRTWYKKNAHSKYDHYKTLVQVCCDLGQADVAAKICRAIKENSDLPKDDRNVTYITEDIKQFRDKQIGNGVFASVFKGETGKKSCAVKILTDENLSHILMKAKTNRDTKERFLRECEHMTSVEHLHIVQHMAAKKHPKTGELALVLELMDCNLRDYFSSTPREEVMFTVQKSLCTDIISAIQYIHSRKILHLNLHPDNILLDCTKEIPVAKVCGFCMSTLMSTEGVSISLPAFGHRGYLPPEAFTTDSSQFDSNYDIFQFGVLMLQIVQCLPTIRSPIDCKIEFNKLDSSHPLKPLIKECLLEDQYFRPVATQLHSQLISLEGQRQIGHV